MQSLPALLAANQDNIGFADGARTQTLRAALHDAAQIASRLALTPGDVVMVRHTCSLEGVACALAAMVAGCTLLPLPTHAFPAGVPLDHAMTVHRPTVVLGTAAALHEAEYSIVRLRVRASAVYEANGPPCPHGAVDLSAQRAVTPSEDAAAPAEGAPALVCCPLVFSHSNVVALAWALKDTTADWLVDLDAPSLLARIVPRLCFGSGVVQLRKSAAVSAVRRPGIAPPPMRKSGPVAALPERRQLSLASVFLEAAGFRMLGQGGAVTCTLRGDDDRFMQAAAPNAKGALWVTGPGVPRRLDGDAGQAASRFAHDDAGRLWLAVGENAAVGANGARLFVQRRPVRLHARL